VNAQSEGQRNIFVKNILCASLDGFIAEFAEQTDSERLESQFGHPLDFENVRKEVEHCDAVILGGASFRASGGRWEIKNDKNQNPFWIVFSKTSTDFSDTSLRFVTHLEEALDFLSQHNLTRVLLFGGGHINQLFYEQGLVDELHLTLSPRLVGKQGAPKIIFGELGKVIDFELISTSILDSHVIIKFRRKKL
jgi:riboflavin biosynthesis pyrimidine reductase